MAEKPTGSTARLIAEEENSTRESDERERDYSELYAASSPDAPGDAEIRSEGALGHHRSVPDAFEKDQGWWGSE
jgi:hypothetical protein